LKNRVIVCSISSEILRVVLNRNLIFRSEKNVYKTTLSWAEILYLYSEMQSGGSAKWVINPLWNTKKHIAY
jgi:hypothetical protein